MITRKVWGTTWRKGDTVTAADLNKYVREIDARLVQPTTHDIDPDESEYDQRTYPELSVVEPQRTLYQDRYGRIWVDVRLSSD